MENRITPKISVKKTVFYNKDASYHEFGYCAYLTIGVQSFELAFRETKKEAEWVAKQLRHAFKALAPYINQTDGWVSVKDGLPKTEYKYHSIPVDIHMDDSEVLPTVGGFYSKENGFHTDEGLQYNGVTHWRYILPPTKQTNKQQMLTAIEANKLSIKNRVSNELLNMVRIEQSSIDNINLNIDMAIQIGNIYCQVLNSYLSDSITQKMVELGYTLSKDKYTVGLTLVEW